MKRIYLLPNVITAFGLSCGLYIIFRMCVAQANEVSFALLFSMASILLLAAFADLLDGAVARAIKAESDFGGLFDSLADGITFGVGPSVVILKSIAYPASGDMLFFITIAAIIFSVCGVLRLVRFNLMSSAAKDSPHLSDASSKNFTGMPIPAAAIAAVSLNLFLISDELQKNFPLSYEARYWILFSSLIVLGYLMISRWKFPSIKNLHLKVRSFRIVLFTVLVAVMVVYGILHHFAVIFFVISWLYPLIALILSIARIIAGRKAKALEDFEPENDDLETDN